LNCTKIMQQKRSKRYRAASEKLDAKKHYPLDEAVAVLKTLPPAKFDQTVTLRLSVGLSIPSNPTRWCAVTCPLPNGSGKNVRVLVFAQGQAADAAREAGAEYVGFEDMIKKCQEGFQDFDVAIATPAAIVRSS